MKCYYIIQTIPLSLANWLCLATYSEQKGGCPGDHRGEYRMWEVRIWKGNTQRGEKGGHSICGLLSVGTTECVSERR